jgi:hypothetical protein
MTDLTSTEAMIRRLEMTLAQGTDTGEVPRARIIGHIEPGGRVVVVPAPNGQVRLVGLGAEGQWVAEFSCLEEDFHDDLIRRMKRHVSRHAKSHVVSAT